MSAKDVLFGWLPAPRELYTVLTEATTVGFAMPIIYRW